MSDFGKAVFLSYASQDADAARRIAEALRAAGVEVWFDQNELVGGDAWDAKIRNQIGECALFVPIISANTQARREGYFRLEWRIAAQRTHMMSEQVAFLLPVVIDDTRDAVADVPAEFKGVQWTRLPGGETTEAFCGRVIKLLAASDSSRPIPVGGSLAAPMVAPSRRKVARIGYGWAAVGIVFALAYAARPMWQSKREPAVEPRPAVVAPETVSEARRLAEQAMQLLTDPNLNRESSWLADELCERALKLDAGDAEVWAVAASASLNLVTNVYDTSSARREKARTQSQRALQLDPQSVRARLVVARYEDRWGSREEARLQLQRLHASAPDDPEVMHFLIRTAGNSGDEATARATLEKLRAAPRSPWLVLNLWYESVRLRTQGRFAEAARMVDEMLRAEPPMRGGHYERLLLLEAPWHEPGELDAFVRRIPPQFLPEPSFGSFLAHYHLGRGDSDAALAALGRVPQDYLEEFNAREPRGLAGGWAHALAGRTAAAQANWREALAVVEARLRADPQVRTYLAQRALLLALTGQAEAAREARRLWTEMNGESAWSLWANRILLHAALGEQDEALAALDQQWPTLTPGRRVMLLRQLRFHPAYAALRRDPRGERFLATASEALRLEWRRQQAADAAPSAGPAPKADDQSVAVLAFANLSDDKANEYFSDGISEELLNVLAKVPGLKVSARTSAFHFKGRNTPIPEIAKQLGVAYVVEGSVRRQGDKVRITAQLIKAADGFHVWSETFTRDLKDIFAVQDEIAGLIARNISPKLTQATASAARQVDPEAFQLYLEGRALAAKAGIESLKQAIGRFELAVARDPGLHLARVQQARAYVQLGRWGGIVPSEAWAAARTALAPALAAEPDAPEVLVAQGWILRTADWKWREAGQAFARALALRPSDPDVLVSAAVLKAGIGRSDEAHALARRAIELDPLNPATQFDIGLIYRFSDRLPEAERHIRRAIELSPGGQRYRTFLAMVAVGLGRHDEAAELARDEPDELSRSFVEGFIAAGRRDGQRLGEIIAGLDARRPALGWQGDYHAYLASLRVAAGDLDGGLAELEMARAARDPSIGWVKVNYLTRPLHAHPRWPEFLRSVGLADDQLR